MKINNKVFKQTALLLLGMTAALGVAQAKDHGKFITVTGTGQISAQPDTAWLTSGVETRADTAAQAVQQNNKLMQQVIEVFLEADIDKKQIQTSGFNVSPVYDYSRDNRAPKLIGYQVSNNVTVKVTKLEQLGELLDEVVESGSNQISGVRFGFDDDEALLDKARKAAIANAKKKVELYAEAADVDVGDVISISEGRNRAPDPVYYGGRARLQEASFDSAVPVQAGEQEVSASVTVVYELDD